MIFLALNWIKGTLLNVFVKYPWQISLVLAILFGAYEYRENHKHIAQIDAIAKVGKTQNNLFAKDAINAQDDHDKMAAVSNDILAAYARAHPVFVRIPNSGAGKGAGADIHENTTANSELATTSEISVTITRGDLATCDADYVYAKSAYDWAESLK